MSDCSKISYVHRWEAVVAMRAIARAYTARGAQGPRGAYFCSACRRWHLTSRDALQAAPWTKARATR
jgi:hypothetical protein